MKPESLGVIGLGAIGGSVAWQAALAGVRRVIGFSPKPAEAVAAAKAGAITEVAGTPRQVARHAEFIVIAAPPAATLVQLAALAPDIIERKIFCTDVASVKSPVAAHAEKNRIARWFAGSHPLAGTHRTGFAAAQPNRFAGAVVYVTPGPGGDEAGREVADFWAGVLGANPVTVDPVAHDRLLAWTSHLPQAVASALAAALARSGPPGMSYGTGARDTTRLAASSVEMWRDIMLLNRDALLPAIDGLEDQLGALRRALTEGDVLALTRWLETGAEWRQGLGE